jgi:hypothetical protein
MGCLLAIRAGGAPFIAVSTKWETLTQGIKQHIGIVHCFY